MTDDPPQVPPGRPVADTPAPDRRGRASGADGLRSDAALNRGRIVDAAREAFAARGLDVPMAAIARHAGVGVATLFRRFPSKQALVAEVFAEQLTACEQLLETALTDPDPWRGFCDLLEAVCRMQIRDRGFTDAFLATYPDPAHDDIRGRAERGFADLVARAQATGRLRHDFAPGDLTLILLANQGVTAAPSGTADAVSARLVAYLLQSFEAHPDAAAPHLPAAVPLGIQAVHDVSRC